jgi:hypothetical protein
MLIVIGTVIQDVVADAMSTEVVARRDAAGTLGRRRRYAPTSYGPGDRSLVAVVWHPGVAGLSGWLASCAHPQDGISAGTGGPGGFGHRRAADRAGDERTSAARLAHSRRRHSVRRAILGLALGSFRSDKS